MFRKALSSAVAVVCICFLQFAAIAHAVEAPLSLADCIALAIRENRTIKNAYLERELQRYTLRIAEDTFVPTFTVTPSISGTGTTTALGGSSSDSASGPTLTPSATATITERLPTGATLNLNSSYDLTSSKGASQTRKYGWNVALTQPLLKGGGLDVNLAALRQSRRVEQNNILNLKNILTSSLNNVTSAYRSYVQSIKSLEITRQSLERSRELVATNRELIAAGRMAAIEIVQSEADLANREFSLLSAENALDAARLALTKAIDIDKNSRITPIPETNIPPVPFTLQQATQLAFENRPDYQQLLLQQEDQRAYLMVARNNSLWDLSLSGNYSENYSRYNAKEPTRSSGFWQAGLFLTIPLDNLYRSNSERQTLISAEIGLKKFENDLARQRENISIEVQDALRGAEMKLRQIKLATLARTLSEKKVEIETEKLKAGRSTNFQLVSYQNDLVSAQNNELDAIITYLNALTSLESTLGITLERWGVTLSER